jgi:acyl dehydratase
MARTFTYATVQNGDDLGAITHHVSAELAEAYRLATGDAPPSYAEGEAPIAPPGLAVTFSTLVFGVPGPDRPSGDIHVAHQLDCVSPLRIGQTVTSRGYVVDKYVRKGRRYVVFDTLTADERGRLLVRCRVTLAVPE